MKPNSPSIEKIVLDVMRHQGFRRNYEVAEYFGVTPQTLSGWIKTNTIPPKHYMKYEQEIIGSTNYIPVCRACYCYYNNYKYPIISQSFTH